MPDASGSRQPLAVLGTAGHVDHGKTSLVFALTGMDTDRLPEERARGISIELGFAWLDRAPGRIAIIDVPGHERFVRQMISGAAGIDAVMLVVAADEGVMPQTREHLDICRLLGVRHGLVALTRADLAGPELLELAREDVEQAVRGTFLEGAPILPCSIHDEASIARLRLALDALVSGIERSDEADRPFLLAVDRAFSRPGFGTIATGTSRSGAVAVGDELVIHHPQRPPTIVRVRGLEVHGHPEAYAPHGRRVALNLSGVSPEEVPRGARLCHPGEAEPTPHAMWDVTFEALPRLPIALADGEKGLACFGASVVEAALALLDRESLAPGAEAFAQLRLAEPLALLPGERWIFRGFRDLAGLGATLGGGRVLAPSPRRRKRGSGTATLEVLADHDVGAAVAELVRSHGEAGLAWRRLHASLPWPRAALDAAVRSSDLIATSPDPEVAILASRGALDALLRAVEELLRGLHQGQPSLPGMLADELRTRLRPSSDPALFGAVLDHLVTRGALRRHGQHLALPGFAPATSTAERALERALLELLVAADLAPPRVDELAGLLSLEPPVAQPAVDAAVNRLVTAGELVRVQKDTAFSRTALSAFEARVRAYFETNEWLDAQALKQLAGTSRKWAIPLGEWLDRARVTVRVGERRRVRR